MVVPLLCIIVTMDSIAEKKRKVSSVNEEGISSRNNGAGEQLLILHCNQIACEIESVAIVKVEGW